MKSDNMVLTEADLSFAVSAAEVAVVRPQAREIASDSPFTPVVTFVLWVSCALIGVLGFAMPYSHPQVAKVQPEPVQVEMLNVELTSDPLPDLAPPMAN